MVLDMASFAGLARPLRNAIPAVVGAPPGIVTYNDLPLIVAKGVVSQG